MKVKLTSVYVDDQSKALRFYFTEDIKGDYERIKARGTEFTMPPTDTRGAVIAKLNDGCGNHIQLTQLLHG
jgi:predicted enzyme related to lactoylglutathione lyase